MEWFAGSPLSNVDCELRLGQPFNWYAAAIDQLEAKRPAIRAGDLEPWQAIDVFVEHVLCTEPAYIIDGPVPNVRADTRRESNAEGNRLVAVYDVASVWNTANRFNDS